MFSYIIRCVIFFWSNRFEESVKIFENLSVPSTIIKENNGDTAGNQHNQYKWQKELESQEKVRYFIENITLTQEPTETLNMSVTLLRLKSKCQAECLINCTAHCRVTPIFGESQGYCPSCGNRATLTPISRCPDKRGSILYDLKLDFHNYLHEFSSSYSYEVTCRISRANKPDEFLFLCAEPRLKKSITFKRCYASPAYDDEFDVSSEPNLYFSMRRLDSHKTDVSIPSMFSFISTLRNSDGEGSKVILQVGDGQFTVHKSVLSQNSDVFRAMFDNEMREKQDGVVKIFDVEAKVVEKMIDYLYTGKLENITGMAQELFKLAHQYQLNELCRLCIEHYIFNVNINNDYIVEILEIVDLYELKRLKKTAEKFVQRYEKELSKLPGYHKYLCQSINIGKAVNTLILADKYNLDVVKIHALEFIKANYYEMAESEDFLKLFESNPPLMKEIYLLSSKKDV